MSARYEWLGATQAEVGGAAQPGQVIDGNGNQNDVACITIANRYSGDTFVLEGRPEDLLTKAREILVVAEQIVNATARDPKLRRLYGLGAELTR